MITGYLGPFGFGTHGSVLSFCFVSDTGVGLELFFKFITFNPYITLITP